MVKKKQSMLLCPDNLCIFFFFFCQAQSLCLPRLIFSFTLTCLTLVRLLDASKLLFPTWGQYSFLNQKCFLDTDRKVPAGCRAPLIGKGASLPSVAGAGALQPCAGRLKQSIIIVGNKHRLPAKSWSALSVGAFYFLPTILAARILKYFSSSNMLFIEIVVVTRNVFGHATFFKKSFPSNELLLFLQHCDMVAIIGADRLQILSERLGASRLI